MKTRSANPPFIQPSLFGRFYKNKSVLVTGHTGFKGSWLALWLHEQGADVTGLALPPATETSHFDLIGLQDLINHRLGDIRDLPSVQKAFVAARPEIVFHLAAQPIVRESYDDPKMTFDTNIGGTVNILEAVRRCPSVKAVVVITSDKCYENNEWVWGYRESDPVGGHDPYSASKGAVEIVCSSYLRSYFQKSGRGPHLGFATARAGNVIGGGDWAKDRIIPDCVRALSKDEPIIIRNPQAVRPWQHVLDPLCGYLLLAKRLLMDPDHFSGSWNFGPVEEDQISVLGLANKFIAAWGCGQIETPPPGDGAPHEAHLLKLCIDKAVRELQWRPVLNSKYAIDWTVDWYKAWHERKADMRGFSIKQITEFEMKSKVIT
jgi:CDP-glucose 4,6-dehydratase